MLLAFWIDWPDHCPKGDDEMLGETSGQRLTALEGRMALEGDLTPEEIEELNAAGPYNSGVWRGRGVTITLEETLTGRVENLGALIKQTLLSTFTREEMASMSIADVGCYDGWLLEHLSNLPFKKFVGFEPRQRNIDKGKTVRRILRIPSKVEYRLASLETLGDEQFDVLICTGLLHHVEDIGAATRKLAQICRNFAFVETQCLSEGHEKALLPEVEPKDIVYFDEVRRIGVIGCKFESDFYDGSAARSTVVGVPSPSAVEMYLEQAGFSHVEMVMKPSSPWEESAMQRQAKVACFVAKRGAHAEARQKPTGVMYEEGLSNTHLPSQTITYLFDRYCLGKGAPSSGQAERAIDEYLAATDAGRAAAWEQVAKAYEGKFEQEIVKNLRYAPKDKIALEMAKFFFANREYAKTIEVCKTFTTRINADWRVCYRAFILMSRSAQALGDSASEKRYVELARSAHPVPSALDRL